MNVEPGEYFLADDLSGALDAAGAFHRVGRRVRIVLRPDAWNEARPGEMVALTTETRNVDPATAARRVAEVLALGKARNATLCYKKVDSTLRGRVSAELNAVMDGLPGTRLLFAPANPRVGRTVSGGVLYVNGIPVAETPFGQDPLSPLTTSSIRGLLGEVLARRLEIPDTLTDADLHNAVADLRRAGKPWVGVGSGALAIAVAAGLPKRRDDGGDAPDPVDASPVLLVGGSTHPLNGVQISELIDKRKVAAFEVVPDAAAVEEASAALEVRGGRAVIVRAPVMRIDPGEARRALVATSLRLIEAGGVRRVFCTGGETAFAICDALGIRTLRFADEIEPGLALAYGRSRVGNVVLAVKPGGFGDSATWIRAYDRLCVG